MSAPQSSMHGIFSYIFYTFAALAKQTSPNCRHWNRKCPASSRKTSRINAAASLSSAPMISGATSRTVTCPTQVEKKTSPKVQLFFWWTPWTKSRDLSSIFEGWAGLLGRSSFDLQVSWTLKRLDLWSHAQNNHGSSFLKLQLTHFGNRRVKNGKANC